MQNLQPVVRAPSFAVLGKQPLRPSAIVGALLITATALLSLGYAFTHPRQTRHTWNRVLGRKSADETAGPDDEKDDPSQVDTVVLGDPVDAPEPQRRHGHAGSVHPTILVRLPRFGPETGLIPNTPAGHLLYAWLAAFNQSSETALQAALPSADVDTAAAQLLLRQQTGGFNLVSAIEVEPGLLVFRLRDQTPAATEALGTLQMRSGSEPPEVLTFSLHAAQAAP